MASSLMKIIPLWERIDKLIILPKKWLESKTLSRNPVIRFGHRKLRATLRSHSRSAQSIYLSQGLIEELSIPYTDPILIREEEGELVLGPLVGIVTYGVSDDPFDLQKRRFLRILRSLLNPMHPKFPGGFYFLFDYQDVNWDDLTVKGYFYRPHGKLGIWEMKEVPFPDVIYNKILSRKLEDSPDVKRFFELLYTRTRSQIFNEAYFQKWDIYQRLSAFENLREMIPETYLNPTVGQVEEMLDRYPMLYLKPSDGLLGLGIYQVLRQGRGIRVRYRLHDRNLSKVYPSVRAFFYEAFPERKRRKYVVQQGIPLMRLDDDPVDFRVHLNKNRRNRWVVTGVGAKKAGKGSVTTHIRAGGKALEARQVLNQFFSEQGEEMYQRLCETAVAVAIALERSLQKPIGELGLDLGIDWNGKIWLFEANSKPGRSIFEKIEELRAESFKPLQHISEYMLYLSRFA